MKLLPYGLDNWKSMTDEQLAYYEERAMQLIDSLEEELLDIQAEIYSREDDAFTNEDATYVPVS